MMHKRIKIGLVSLLVIVPLHGMFQETKSNVAITALDHSKNPDTLVLEWGKRLITVADFISQGTRPVLVSIHNQSQEPIIISSVSCPTACIQRAQLVATIGHQILRNSGRLLLLSMLVSLGASAIIAHTAGGELVACTKEAIMRRAHERADKGTQRWLARLQELFSWISLLSIPYANVLYKLLAKRLQIVPFFKRTLPSYVGRSVAYIKGVPYYDDYACKTVVSEFAARSQGTWWQILTNYMSLFDWNIVAQILRERTPTATLCMLVGLAGIVVTPSYLLSQHENNYLLDKKLKKLLLTEKSIRIMPGAQTEQWLMLPTLSTDQFIFRIFDTSGAREKIQFNVKFN